MPRDLVPSQQQAIESTGLYETATIAAIRRIARPGMRTIECGSNCGYHTLTLANAVSPGGQVYAYEANPELIPVIERKVAAAGLTGMVEIHQQGVWGYDGVLPFPIRSRSLGGAGLKPKTRNPYRRYRNSRKIKRYENVEVLTLESMCRDREIDLIRMDVEGAELEAVRGSQEFLRSSAASIILEWIPRRSNRKDALEFFGLLIDIGYHVYRIAPEGLRPIASAEAFHNQHAELWQAGHCDVLCCKSRFPEDQLGWDT